MKVAARIRQCRAWMLRCANQSTMTRRERRELVFESVGVIGVGVVVGDGRSRLNRSKTSSDKKIRVVPLRLHLAPAPSQSSPPTPKPSPSPNNPLPKLTHLLTKHKLKQLRSALLELVGLRACGGVEDREASVDVPLVCVDAERYVYFYGFGVADVVPVFPVVGDRVSPGRAHTIRNKWVGELVWKDK